MDHTPPEHHSHKFQVNTGPDPEDLLEDIEGLPDLLDIEESDDELDKEDNNQGWYSDIEGESSDNPQTEASKMAEDAYNATAEEEWPGKEHEAPLQPVTKQALEFLKILLNPAWKTGWGYVDPELDSFVRSQMEGMQTMLNFYTHKQSLTYNAWAVSLLQASMVLGMGLNCAC